MLLTPEITSWAGRHHGLVSLPAWLAGGRSATSFYRSVREGSLVLVAPRVAALPGRPVGPLERIAAGALSFGPDVVASHRSAAWLWGGHPEPARQVDLITLRRNHRTVVPGFVVHRPRDQVALRPVRRHGVPCTSALRTLVDLGAVAPGAVGAALESFLVAGHVNTAGVRAALARHRRSGRSGVVALERAIDDVLLRAPESALEATMARLFHQAGIHRWVAHTDVEGYVVDFCFGAERLVVEVDGWAWHGAQRNRWEQDRWKDARLAAAGWLVLRLTWRMVTHQPALVVARLQATLSARQPAA